MVVFITVAILKKGEGEDCENTHYSNEECQRMMGWVCYMRSYSMEENTDQVREEDQKSSKHFRRRTI